MVYSFSKVKKDFSCNSTVKIKSSCLSDFLIVLYSVAMRRFSVLTYLKPSIVNTLDMPETFSSQGASMSLPPGLMSLFASRMSFAQFVSCPALHA